jgi:hypothetical protein
LLRHAQAPRRAAGALLLGLSVGVYPLLTVAAGRPLSQAEVIGLAPDPIVMALLGLLLSLRATGGLERLMLALLWLGGGLVRGRQRHAVDDGLGAGRGACGRCRVRAGGAAVDTLARPPCLRAEALICT